MYARSTTFLAQPGSIDEGGAYVDDEVMPALMDMDGCIGLSMICDRDSGRCIVTSAWSTEDAMSATEQRDPEGGDRRGRLERLDDRVA